jgi:hypothetical protein
MCPRFHPGKSHGRWIEYVKALFPQSSVQETNNSNNREGVLIPGQELECGMIDYMPRRWHPNHSPNQDILPKYPSLPVSEAIRAARDISDRWGDNRQIS